MSKTGLSIALMCAAFTSGCEPLENVIKASGATDSIGQMKQGIVYQSETESNVTVDPDDIPPEVVAQAAPPAPPPCEPIRWRYIIYDCNWNQIGSYE